MTFQGLVEKMPACCAAPVISYFCKVVRRTNKNSFYKWTKISSLEINIFYLKMMVKSGLEFFILKFTKPLQSC